MQPHTSRFTQTTQHPPPTVLPTVPPTVASRSHTAQRRIWRRGRALLPTEAPARAELQGVAAMGSEVDGSGNVLETPKVDVST